MARIAPVTKDEIRPGVQSAFEKHVKEHDARITNMKSTLGHSLLAFEIYMQWYPLYEQVEKILGKRLAYVYAYSISTASDCPLCSTFFRKIIIDAGEKPEELVLTPAEKAIIEFGSHIAKFHGNISDSIYQDLAGQFSKTETVILVAFAGQMIATNIFNNVFETNIDDYLTLYLPPVTATLYNEE